MLFKISALSSSTSVSGTPWTVLEDLTMTFGPELETMEDPETKTKSDILWLFSNCFLEIHARWFSPPFEH